MAAIEWQQPMDEQAVWDIIHHVPDKDSMHELKEKVKTVPHGYYGLVMANESEQIKLCALAVEQAFKQLEKLRKEGIPTHANAHAVGTCFQKCFVLLRSQFREFPGAFRDVLMPRIEAVSIAFKPVLDVLVSGFHFHPEFKGDEREGAEWRGDFSKRDKETLVRAFWPAFSEAWASFSGYDWVEEYKTLWDLTLAHYKVPAQVETKMDPLCTCGHSESEHNNTLRDRCGHVNDDGTVCSCIAFKVKVEDPKTEVEATK